jgi:hypothetical protein
MNNFISNNIIKLFKYNHKINNTIAMFFNITSLMLFTSLVLYYIDIFDFHVNNEIIYDKLTTQLVKIGYNIVYLYSVCQIKMNKIITYVSLPYIHLVKYFKKAFNDKVEKGIERFLTKLTNSLNIKKITLNI